MKSLTQEQIDQAQKTANETVSKLKRYHSVSEVIAHCMCGATLCLIADMAMGKVVDMPNLSSFWTVAFILLMFVILLCYVEHLRQKLSRLHEALGYVANDVTMNISTH